MTYHEQEVSLRDKTSVGIKNHPEPGGITPPPLLRPAIYWFTDKCFKNIH